MTAPDGSNLPLLGLPPPPCFNIKSQDLIDEANAVINELNSIEDRLVSFSSTHPAHDIMFLKFLQPIAYAENRARRKIQYIAMFQHLAQDLSLRKAATEAIALINEALFKSSTRVDVFQMVQLICENGEQLDPEDHLFLQKRRREGIQNGLQTPEGESRERFKVIRQRLLHLRNMFMQNLTEDQAELLLLVSELLGVSEQYISALQYDANGFLRIPLKKPDITTILNTCQISATRRKVFEASQKQNAANVPIFQETIHLRDESARLLGYRNYAALRLESLMAKSPENVQKFLADLATRLMPKAKEELSILLATKRKDLSSADKELQSDFFFHWDFPFYHHQLLHHNHNIDDEYGRDFLDYLLFGILPHTSRDSGNAQNLPKLFGLDIQELRDLEQDLLSQTGKASDCVWHSDVKMYGVWNGSRSKGEFLGYLYMDLYPREGKYTHNANFVIYPGCVNEEGLQQFVATALVCNISRPTNDKTSFLKHQEVVTLFHELGHGMHDLLSKTKYACFHGTNTVSDFIEAPSQLLEFWCWQPQVLREMSCHVSYLSSNENMTWKPTKGTCQDQQPPLQIPFEVVERLCNARRLNQALLTLRQVGLSVFDMTVHTPKTRHDALSLNINEIYNSTRREYGLLDGPEVLGEGMDWSHAYVSTQHFMWGQDANYYSYLYSKVFAADIYYHAFRDDPMNVVAGEKYRYSILEKGGSQNEMDMLVNYLGRYPNAKAFEEELGI